MIDYRALDPKRWNPERAEKDREKRNELAKCLFEQGHNFAEIFGPHLKLEA